MEAACRYMLDPPGSVRETFAALESPRTESVLDVQYEWLLALDALRTGDREAAVGHLTLVAGSYFPVAAQARALLDRLEGPNEPAGEPEGSDAGG
jgi:hypothetical protein